MAATPLLPSSHVVPGQARAHGSAGWGVRVGGGLGGRGVVRCSVRKKDKVRIGSARRGQGLEVSSVGVGTLQWGDPGSGYGKEYGAEELQQTYRAARRGGVTFFDTAEVYGFQGHKRGEGSEQLVAQFALDQGDTKAVIGTKVFTIPWTNLLVGGRPRLLNKDPLLEALRASCGRMAVPYVDLWSIHTPFPGYRQSTLCDALAEAVENGLAKTVGVSNYNEAQMREAAALLAERGIQLATNQVEFSLDLPAADTRGLIAAAEELGVQIVAYSPLWRGRLTGSERSRAKIKDPNEIALVDAVAQVAERVGKTPGQVALNYTLCKGALPIAGCKSAQQAKEHAGAMGWRLGAEDLRTLDAARLPKSM